MMTWEKRSLMVRADSRTRGGSKLSSMTILGLGFHCVGAEGLWIVRNRANYEQWRQRKLHQLDFSFLRALNLRLTNRGPLLAQRKGLTWDIMLNWGVGLNT